MKKYIFFTILIISFLFLLTGCSKKEKPLTDIDIIKSRGYLIVGVKTDSPPFGYYKDESLAGVDVELAKKIAHSIFKENNDQRVSFVSVTPQNRISKLNSKEVDMLIATMSINSKRKLVIDFSTPYFETTQKIMVLKDSPIKSLSYFNKNGKLAVVMGTTGEKIVRQVVPNAQVIGAKNYNEALYYLIEGNVDAVFGDDCILKGLNNGEFKIVNRAYSKEHYGVAVRKSENSKEMLNLVNTVILSLLDKKALKVEE